MVGQRIFIISTFIIALVYPSFATTPDIAANATSASCTDSALNTNNGPANIEVNWEPNTIELHWYNRNTEIATGVPTSCTYGDGLNMPSTIPTRTGYTFAGWRVRCFANSMCGLTGSDIDQLMYIDQGGYAFYGHSGSYKQNESLYGLSAGEWALKFTNGGIVKGTSSCNSVSPTVHDYEDCYSDVFKPSGTFEPTASGQGADEYCWCKLISYTPAEGSACNLPASLWVHGGGVGSALGCEIACASNCAAVAAGGYLRALFGVAP